jgi:restriction endonuclease Mrr
MDNIILEEMLSSCHVTKLDTESLLTDYFKKNGYNAFKASEYAQQNITNFIEFINSSVNKARSKNVPYLLSSATKDIVQINPDYFQIKLILKKLLEVKWRDFEFISADILEICFGAFDVKTTNPTGDGGVDFEGKIPIQSKNSKDIFGEIEVYGQSKRYTGNVGIYDIKSFVAFANSKKRNYVHPPQVFMLFTTSDFADNAMRELNINSFMGLSGFQLASLIYYHLPVLKEKNEIFKEIIPNMD